MKKIFTLALSCLLLFSAVACNSRTNTNNTTTTPNENTTTDGTMDDSAYYGTYRGLYNTNLSGLTGYQMYTDVESVNNAYRDREYPGNEQYLKDVKAAYRDSRDKLQAFVNGLKNDAKTENEEIKTANDELIAEGEKLIKDIDAKIKQLDTITEADYSKGQAEFITLVHDTVNKTQGVTNRFTDMLRNMNERLGINNNTNNMDNNTNNNMNNK